MLVKRKQPLQALNTLALQAQATALARIGDEAALGAALQWARAEGLPVMPLGEGSNIVLAADLEALVLKMETRGIHLLEESSERVVLRVAAGENWHALVQWTLQRGYYGLENLALIPGTVGAAPIQNIGAYGVELAAFVRAVHGLGSATHEAISLSCSDCEFAYRDSIFKHSLRDRVIITAVDIELSRTACMKVDYPALALELDPIAAAALTPQDVFDAVVRIRSSKLPDPARVPNAGSFFKNPVLSSEVADELASQFPELPQYPQPDGGVKLPAAWLIDHCGWKGFRRDGLGVHPEHALVLVNYGSDSGAQLLALAADVAASVQDSFDIELEIEPRVYGAAA